MLEEWKVNVEAHQLTSMYSSPTFFFQPSVWYTKICIDDLDLIYQLDLQATKLLPTVSYMAYKGSVNSWQ